MENEQLNQYLVNKGFTVDDLLNASAVFLDNGNIKHSQKDLSWLETKLEAVTTEGEKQLFTPLDIVNKKKFQYQMDNCNSAIFIPLFKLNGEFTGFSIRKMCDKKHDSWFVPGSRKIDLLYNLSNAFEHAIAKNSIIVTEGVYDTIALVKYGFKNSVALLGTHMSNLQFFQLMSIVENIALCLDDDEAGVNAMDRIMKEHTGDVTYWRVNIDKDPDEFLSQNGSDVFRKRIYKCVKN